MIGFSFRTWQDDYYDGYKSYFEDSYICSYEFDRQQYIQFMEDTDDDEVLELVHGRGN